MNIECSEHAWDRTARLGPDSANYADHRHYYEGQQVFSQHLGQLGRVIGRTKIPNVIRVRVEGGTVIYASTNYFDIII